MLNYSYYVECIYNIDNIATWTYKINNTITKNNNNRIQIRTYKCLPFVAVSFIFLRHVC